MSDPLQAYLENIWALLDNDISEVEISILRKLFQAHKSKMNIIDSAYQKIKSIEHLPTEPENCAKLMLDILVAEAYKANKMITLQKQNDILNIMLIALKENESLIKSLSEKLPENKAIFSISKALALIKLTLSLAAGAAALWFTGPYCALAARHLFSAGYIALHGEPDWVVRYSYFVPAQEWIGNLAFEYGPKLLALPTGVMSAKAIDVTMEALNHAQKMLTFFYRQTLKQNASKIKVIPENVFTGLGCYL